MALLNRYNEIPESLPNKEFALVKFRDGFAWYVGDENNLPVPTSNKIIRGTTSQRPILNESIVIQYFDTTLNKPIWWNGSGWVDANGTTV